VKQGKDRMLLMVLVLLTGMSACARTAVRPQQQTTLTGFPRPQRVLVYDFAATEDDVKRNQSIIARVVDSASTTTERERKLDVAHQVVARMAEDLVAGINDLGLPAQRAFASTPVSNGDLLILGQFLNVDEGNRLRRLVVGFGAGGSTVDTQVLVYQASARGDDKLLEFATHADSGKMPGAAATMGAGSAAQGGVTAGMAAANVAVSGVKGYRSAVEGMAGRSADQAVAYLSEFFARQRWIPADKVKNAERD
jgi:hypothetical protein